MSPTSTMDVTAPAIAPLVTAFSSDPVVRWFLPSADVYLDAFPRVVALMGAGAFATGHADCHDRCAAAIWVPPDAPPADEGALVDLLQASIDDTRQEAAFAILERMAAHHPHEPHWYLPFIGTDPGWQGRGLGSSLLALGTARCDADGTPAYLEASTPANRRLYERHGFEVTGEIQEADSPPIWPMLRPASGTAHP